MHSALLILAIFLIGCTVYNPPKYVCACLATCYERGVYNGERWETTRDVVHSAAIGGGTPEETRDNCLNAARKACPDGEIINFTCSPMSWGEWSKIKRQRP